MKKLKQWLLIGCLLHSFSESKAIQIPHYQQSEQDTLYPKRLKTLLWAGSTGYALGITGLSFIWYSDGLQKNFQFFDDNAEWKQMDKVGHFYSTFQISNTIARGFKWSGLSSKKAAFWGTIAGIAMMTPIEILDGFSADYGASWGDWMANAAGAGFLYSQYVWWNEIRLHPKFSFRRTHYAPQRPDLLGSGLQEEIIKDYNGQTYWLSVDLDKFFGQKKKRFPKWLNVALGYGANDMLFAQDKQNQAIGLNPYRQFYLGLDFDLSSIKTKSGFVKSLLYLVNMIRLPAPALEYNTQDKFRFHWLYF